MICKMYAVKDIKVFDKKLKAPGGSILIYSLLSINRRIDPSNTGLLRRAFEKEFKKRFQELKRVLVEAVLDRNVFGLQTYQLSAPLPGAFNFSTNPKKIEEFNKWLERQIHEGLLEVKKIPGAVTGVATDTVWINSYITDSYKKGVLRARYEMAKAGMKVPSIEKTGGIGVTMNVPVHVNTLWYAYTRAFEELKGITNDMGSKISKVLARGLAEGDGPRELARKLVSVIDGKNAGTLGITDTLGRFIPPERRALLLARTEIIRAHHLATIAEYEQWGVKGVNVQLEWRTAGDGRVCPDCASMNGKVFSLEQIKNMIPAHPQCRCVALPVIKEGEKNLTPVKTKPEETKVGGIEWPKSEWDGWKCKSVDDFKKALLKFQEEAKKRYSFEVVQNFNIPFIETELSKMEWDKIALNIPRYLEGICNCCEKIEGVTRVTYVFVHEGPASFIIHVNAFSSEGCSLVVLKREFNFFRKENPFVEHSYFRLSEKLQGKGISKELFVSLYREYVEAGIKKIHLEANLSVGGYAWGRYGFGMEGEDNIRKWILSNVKGSEVELKVQKEMLAIVDTFYSQNSKDAIFPMYLLVDNPHWRKYFLEKTWTGVLDLSNPVQKERFESYIFGKKIAKETTLKEKLLEKVRKDPVASLFKEEKDGIKYLEYFENYCERLRKIENIESLKNMSGNELLTRIYQFTEEEMKELELMRTSLMEWQKSTMHAQAIQLKKAVIKYEKDVPSFVGRDDYKQAFEEISKDLYLKFRAVNQAWLEVCEKKESYSFFRGLGKSYQEILSEGVKEVTIEEASLIGYTENKRVMFAFGPVYYKRKVGREQIVVCRKFLSGWTREFYNEEEWILRGFKDKVLLKLL